MLTLKIFRFFNGFVRVIASGLYPERIINICYKNGLTIWGIKKKNEKLYFNILAKDFKRLRGLRNKCGVSLKIKYKIGLCFTAKKHKNRIGVLVGAVVLIVCLNILSSFVWNINVVGNSKVETKEILDAAKEVGIYEGMLKSKINSPQMRNDMLYKFNKLSWVSFNLEGSLLTINVSETKKVEKNENNSPSNLVATKDGVIKYLEIKSGYSAVLVNQAVKKGDLLVSGVAQFKNGVAEFFNSKGVVLAETEAEFIKTLPLKQEVYVKTGNITKKKVLQFFGLNIPLYIGSLKGNYTKTIEENYIKTTNNYLPIRLVTASFYEIEKIQIIKTEQELKNELSKMATKALKTEKIKKVLSYKDDFTVKNGYVTIKRKAKCLEDITEQKAININTIS